jgi:hypothetical protein
VYVYEGARKKLMTLGKKPERKGKIPEHYQEKNMCGKYMREKESKEKIYVYIVRVICTIVEQKKERKKEKDNTRHIRVTL